MQGVSEFIRQFVSGVIVGSMEITNHNRTWGRKPHLNDENSDISSRREDDKPNEIGDLEGHCRVEETYTCVIFPLIPELLQVVLAAAHQNV
ncbi:hypothetical protein TNCV_3496281 [Trichonephila clavipes]|nr:hypothetical protein TNCV_3496281 [Trichonephila clavipes]